MNACRSTHLDKIERLGGFNFEAGKPEIRLVATGFRDEEGSTYLDVAGEVVHASLIFSFAKESEVYQANFTLQIQVKELTSTATKVIDTTFNETISTINLARHGLDTYHFRESFKVDPGKYLVQAFLTDNRSRKTVEVEVQVETPSQDVDNVMMSKISILGKDSKNQDGFLPITTYDIPSRYDSLQFRFQVTNNSVQNEIEVETRLLKFNSDQSIAAPIYHLSPTTSSIEYKGIDYSEDEEMFKSTRELNLEGSVFVDFYYASLATGNYRLEVRINQQSEGSTYKGIDFAIRSVNYPTLKAPKELARPLKYIMDEREYQQLMNLTSPDSIRHAIEHFWLSNIKNSVLARQVILLYYERVEEANKFFSNFKEGWKTDPGMVYILFGSPWYMEDHLTYMEWAYSYSHNETGKRLFFHQNKPKNKHFPFDHYILERSQRYHTLYYQQVQNWRSGRVLYKAM